MDRILDVILIIKFSYILHLDIFQVFEVILLYYLRHYNNFYQFLMHGHNKIRHFLIYFILYKYSPYEKNLIYF